MPRPTVKQCYFPWTFLHSCPKILDKACAAHKSPYLRIGDLPIPPFNRKLVLSLKWGG